MQHYTPLIDECIAYIHPSLYWTQPALDREGYVGKTIGKAIKKAVGKAKGKAIGKDVGKAVGKAIGKAIGRV